MKKSKYIGLDPLPSFIENDHWSSFSVLTNKFSIYKGMQRMAKTQNTNNGGYVTLLWQVFRTQFHAALNI